MGCLPKIFNMRPSNRNYSSYIDLTLHDGKASMYAVVCCDDSSDYSISSRKVAGSSVVQVVGKLSLTKPVTLQLALKTVNKNNTFSFRRISGAARSVRVSCLQEGPVQLVEQHGAS